MSMERTTSQNCLLLKNDKCKVSPTTSSITVSWEKDATPKEIDCYEIKFKIQGTKRFQSRQVSTDKTELEIDSLESNTSYEINVYWCAEDGTNQLLFQKQCDTDKSNIEYLIKNAFSDETRKPFLHHLKPLSILEYPLANIKRSATDATAVAQVRVCDIISECRPSIHKTEDKTLLLLGATGTGKSTLIDALVNYLANVSYIDNHRFTLISKTEEEKKREDKQYQSQTSSVTVYRIPRLRGSLVKCGVNIIDTPGFNDTREDFDKRITAQIKELFEKRINHLDAILIVVPLSTTRLTEGQKHVFSSILDMFGEDIKQNIFIAVTWYDSGEVKCLSILEAAGIPYTDVFTFNNSNVLSEFSTDEGQTSTINQEFWNNRRISFSMLFKKLESTPITTVTSSFEVMKARCNLEIQLVALEDSICMQAQDVANYKLNKTLEDENEKESRKKKKEAVNKIMVPEMQLQYNGRNSLNCQKCAKTCHRNCWVPLKSLNWTCEAMKSGKCTICKGRCGADTHVLSKDVYELQYTEQLHTYEDVVKMQKEEGLFLIRLQETLEQIESLIKEINSKALKKDALALDQYIKDLVKKEENERKQGFEMRIQIQKAIVNHLKRNNSIWTLSMDYLMKD